ncbi:MAG: hypothetical protein AB7I27_10665 [Bacteriovoracaceae bacterium]
MKDETQYCLICKHLFPQKEKVGKKEILYTSGNKQFNIYLCYTHSVEYFLKAQNNFLLKYNSIISDFCSQVDDPVKAHLTSLEKNLTSRQISPWWKGEWF